MNVATETNRSGVDVVSRHELTLYPRWRLAFASQHKDHRYYGLEDTIHPEFKYRYFVVRDCEGTIAAIQPFFMLDVDLLLAISPYFGQFIDAIRIRWPRFMVARAMMVGCVAGEAHLDDGNESMRATATDLLAMTIEKHARALGVQLIVLKEFPRQYREAMACFMREGFNLTPSMPMTRLNIAYANFEDYMRRALNSDRFGSHLIGRNDTFLPDRPRLHPGPPWLLKTTGLHPVRKHVMRGTPSDFLLSACVLDFVAVLEGLLIRTASPNAIKSTRMAFSPVQPPLT